MFCTHCGQQIKDNSKFCTACGARVDVPIEEQGAPHMQAANTVPEETPVEEKGTQEASAAVSEPSTQSTSATEPVHEAPRNATTPVAGKAVPPLNSKVIGAIAAVAVVVVAVIAFLATRKTTINLSKYIIITCRGYDTVGTASYELDTYQLSEDYGKKLRLDRSKVKNALQENDQTAIDLCDYYGGYDNVAKAIDAIDVTDYMDEILTGDLSPATGISNGDKVAFTWNISDEELERLGDLLDCKFKTGDVEMKASNLQELESFDPFEGFEIAYSGTAPYGKVSGYEKGEDEVYHALDYSFDPIDNLSNGDIVTVTVRGKDNSEDWQTAVAQEYGEIPSQTTKEFAVSGVAEFIASLSDLSDDDQQEMEDRAEEYYYDYIDKSYDLDETNCKIAGMDYVGRCLVTQESDFVRNYLALVYKVRVSSWNTDNGQTTNNEDSEFYWCGIINNIIKNADGTIEIGAVGAGGGWWQGVVYTKDGNWQRTEFLGYETLDSVSDRLMDNIRDNRIKNYTIENDVPGMTISDDSDSKATEDVDDTDLEVVDEAIEESDADDDQILPQSSKSKITEDDLEDLSKDEIQTAINEIYARHGYTFNDETILAHFKEYDWYEPSVASKDFSEDVFSQIEKDNIALMRKHVK